MPFFPTYHNAATGTATAEPITTTGIITADRFRAGNGTQALPAYSYVSDTDTGEYWTSSGVVRRSMNNNNLLTFTTTSISSSLSADIAGYLTLNNDHTSGVLGASQNNYDPGAFASWVRFQSSGAIDITGIANGADGRVLPIVNIGANAITLKNEDANSTAANRFTLPSAADIVLGAGDGCFLLYSGVTSRWLAVGVAL